ncbi:MAG TPA: cell division protein FtsH, partial [Acidimicrobiales bacterium]|nr:cell division protein FtsH [Acidimicrobiales bacterium]
DRVMIGQREESNALLPEEKRSVAVHEAGHAVVAALSMRADPVAKVTILPAGRALGVTEQLPVDEAHLHSESYLTDALNVRLAGRASEILVLGEASTGAANDLSGATDLAGRMVREFGMNHDLGPIGYARDESGHPAAQMGARPYAEATQRAIDEEVARLVTEAEHRATAMLTEHREALDRLVEHLLEEETVDGSAVYSALGLPVHLAPTMRGDQPDRGAVTAPSADTGEAG